MKTKKSKMYMLGDSVPLADRKRLGLTLNEGICVFSLGGPGKVRASLIGEFRPPLKGEWYLSGARPVAYLAPNDFSTAYHICEIFVVETKTTTTTYRI